MYEKPALGWKDTIQPTAFLVPNEPDLYQYLGDKLVLQDNQLFMGAIDTVGRPSVLIFESAVEGWQDTTESFLLSSSLPDSLVRPKGYAAIDINDEILVLGCVYCGPDASGAIMVYEKPATGWHSMQERALLSPEEPVADLGVGMTVLVHRDTIWAGTFSEDRLYGFERPESGWHTKTEDQYLLPNPISSETRYGFSSAIDGPHMLVGATTDDSNGESSGAVHFYYQCQAPDVPNLSVDTLEVGYQISIADRSQLGSATEWALYADDCEGSLVDANQNGIFEVNPTVATTYYLKGIGGACEQGCSNISITPPIVSSDVSIHNSASLQLFPNPATNRLFLRTDLKMERYNIFDNQGRLIFTAATQGHQPTREIDINDLPIGTYRLQVIAKKDVRWASFIRL
ncbi:MAG: T9SS type A sorting domain-containing protein [Bacteroidota bacterium]